MPSTRATSTGTVVFSLARGLALLAVLFVLGLTFLVLRLVWRVRSDVKEARHHDARTLFPPGTRWAAGIHATSPGPHPPHPHPPHPVRSVMKGMSPAGVTPADACAPGELWVGNSAGVGACVAADTLEMSGSSDGASFDVTPAVDAASNAQRRAEFCCSHPSDTVVVMSAVSDTCFVLPDDLTVVDGVLSTPDAHGAVSPASLKNCNRTLGGPWAGLGYLVQDIQTVTLPAVTVKFNYDGTSTRMEGSDGTYRYYTGPISAFDAAQWPGYNQG